MRPRCRSSIFSICTDMSNINNHPDILKDTPKLRVTPVHLSSTTNTTEVRDPS